MHVTISLVFFQTLDLHLLLGPIVREDLALIISGTGSIRKQIKYL